MSITMSQQQARRFLLLHQALLPPRRLRGKEELLAYFDRVGCIQFDPLDQVGYNPNLVLQSRVKGYKPELLNSLLYRDRQLVDGFDKNLAIYRACDWPNFRRYRDQARRRYGHAGSPFLGTVEAVRREIRERGPICSAGIEAGHKVDWPWGPTNAARAALESMYFWGELVVHHKTGTRKYYDLAQRHLPPELLAAPDPHPDERQYHAWHVLRRVGSIGLLWNRAGDGWLGMLGLKADERSRAFADLEAAGALFPVQVEGVDQPCYIRSADREELERSLAGGDETPAMAFLAPLDNLIWDRRLIAALFGFDYKWEVYTPQSQRKYGYYVLPVLYGDRFVARFEPKYDKKEKRLDILNWWWEDGAQPGAALKKAFRAALKEFLRYLGAQDVRAGAGCEWMNL